jgi:hypothetical protein
MKQCFAGEIVILGWQKNADMKPHFAVVIGKLECANTEIIIESVEQLTDGGATVGQNVYGQGNHY